MSDKKWNIVFNNWNDLKKTIYIVRVVLISSILISTFFTVFGFITNTDLRYFALGYSIFFVLLFIVFQFRKKQYILLAFLGSIVLGLPVWMFWKQDPHIIAYITILLIVISVVITKFWFTSAVFAFTLSSLIAFALLDVFGIYISSDPGNSLANEALLHIPMLALGYIVAFYVNKVLINSIKTQRSQYNLLKSTQRKLINQEKNRSIRLLAGGIAHDFNNLLTVILGNINLLRLDLLKYPESLELVEEVENAAIQARDLTKELLTFSKEAIKLREVVNVRELLMKNAKFASSGSKTKTIVEVPQNLWKIQGNPTQLAQVFQNLILNARQAMQDTPHGGTIYVTAENIILTENIRFKDKKNGAYVSIKVIDSGKGIQPEEISKIFSPYWTSKIGSHGLGLAICHTIIQNHNGAIIVESDPGIETVFEVILPAKIPSPEESMKSPVGDILVLEDDANVMRVLRKNQSRIGFSMDFASSCEEVKTLLSESVRHHTPYKVIILDSSIPSDSHLCESTGMLKDIYKDVKIVISSEIAVHPVIKNYKQFGYDAFLPKPYQIREIRNLIQSLSIS